MLAEAHQFQPDLAVGALTLIPLILITATLQDEILPRTARALQQRCNARKKSWRILQAGALFWGYGMIVAAMAAIAFSLLDLVHYNDRWAAEIAWCSAVVTAGLGLAFVRRIHRALVRSIEQPDKKAN
jgi:hypothetical protein